MLPLCCYMSYQVVMFSASKTLSLINYITTSANHDEFKDALLYHDVKKKVAKIHKLLFDLPDTHPSVHMAINDIQETIDTINKIMEEYIHMINNHSYFTFSRTADMNLLHKNLLLHIHLLNTRFDDFIKIMQVLLFYKK